MIWTGDRVFLLALAVVGLIFLTLHERHYRGRRDRIMDARRRGLALPGRRAQVDALQLRVEALEAIVAEDRFT